MADTYYGVARPNWATAPGVQTVTSNMDFITIATNVDLRQTTQTTTASCTASSSGNVTLGSPNTNITVGMVMTGAGVTGTPIVTTVTDSTHIVVSVAQTLSSVTCTFTSQGVAALNKLIEIVSLRGQPIIMSAIIGTSAPFSVYMALEHMGWSVMGGGTTPVVGGTRLIDRIVTDGINFGWTPSGDTGLAVTFGTTLT